MVWGISMVMLKLLAIMVLKRRRRCDRCGWQFTYVEFARGRVFWNC